MTNNFATIKNNLSSNKFYLVRMNPACSIMNSLTLVSGNTYTHIFHTDTLSAIKVNGTAYAKVTGVPIASQYSFDETTRLITITLHDTLVNIQSNGNIVSFYYLFYTDELGIYATEDPEDANTIMRFWEPRLANNPNFQETQEDVIDGFLSVGNTSISLNNEDNNFQKYLTVNDSFCRKSVSIWQCLDDVENIQKFFLGFSIDLKIGDKVDISIDNSFSALNDTVYSGATSIKSIFNVTDYPNVFGESKDTPIYRIYSKVSKTIDSNANLAYTYSAHVNSLTSELQYYLSENCYKLTNINFDTFASTTVNRSWAACFASTASSTLTETASGVSDAGADYGVGPNTVFYVTVADSSFYNNGDNIAINGSYAGRRYVANIDTATRISIWGGVLANGNTITRPAISFIQIWDNLNSNYVYTLRHTRDYTISTDSNGVYIITLVNNFEANFGGSNIVSGIWGNAKLGYRAYNHDDLKHGTILKSIVENIGLTVDNASIVTANSTSLKTNFSIPYFGSISFENANVYLKDLLTSTFGMIYINNSFEVGYVLFNTVSASNDITNDEIIDGTLTQTIDYKDIKTSFAFQNIHGTYLPGFGFLDVDTRSSLAVEKTSSIYLHEMKKQKTINFITEDMTNSKNRIMDVLSNRRARVELTTKGTNFTSLLGDNFNILSDDIIGINASISIKILSINKKADETNIVGFDLYNL